MTHMLSLKELLEIAVAQLHDLTTVQTPDFRLEQAEYDRELGEWNIIVSFLVDQTNKRLNPLGLPASDFQFHRLYKKLRINSDKEVLGLYMFDRQE